MLKICYIVLLGFAFESLSQASSHKNIPISEEKWKVVNFWAEWCAPCRKEIPELNQLAKNYSEKKLQVLGVNFDNLTSSETLDIATKMGVEFQIITTEQAEQLNLSYPIVLPTTYILSLDNKVIKKLIGEQTEQSLLEEFKRLNISL